MNKNKKSKKKAAVSWTIKTGSPKESVKPEGTFAQSEKNAAQASPAAAPKEDLKHENCAVNNNTQPENIAIRKDNAQPDGKSVAPQNSARKVGKLAMLIQGNRLAAILLAVCFGLVVIGTTVGIVLGTKYELIGIEVESLPTKTTYIEKQALDTGGLTVKANYSNKKSVIVDTYSVESGELKLGDNLIKVSYTEKGITKTTMFAVTAVKRSLTELKITEQPAKVSYFENASFDPAGMKVSALYNNGESAETADYTYDKTAPLTTSDKSVVVSYTESEITRTAEIDITVIARNLESIEILTPPTKTDYLEGTVFDPTGLVVKAHFDNDEQEVVTGWDYDNKNPLMVTDTGITVTYGDKSATVAITVNPKILKAIMASSLPQKIIYTEGEYFDFLGVEIYATYENSSMELITAWDYDKKEALTTQDTNVTISYTLHGVTKTIVVGIIVNEAPPAKDAQQELIDKVLKLLPPVQDITAEDLSTLDYALSLLNSAPDLTPEQASLKNALAQRREQIVSSLPPTPETEYQIAYALASGLSFTDIDYGGNASVYKNSDGPVTLLSASSAEAAVLGYEFIGWTLDGQFIAKLENLSGNVTVYAVFKLTLTVNIVFKDYDGERELSALFNVLRVPAYSLDESIDTIIYAENGRLPLAYYTADKSRISAADLSVGAVITIFVKTCEARALHLANADSVTVGWSYLFTDHNGAQQTTKSPSVGMAFVAPVGATVTMVSMHANIRDILIEGVSKGEYLNSSTIQAIFTLTAGGYPVSVTFSTAVSNITTLSFVGYNQHSIVYPAGWDGNIAEVDLDTLAFIFDEASMTYLNLYTIDGTDYYFKDLADYRFGGDTVVWVKRVRNSFSFAIVYANGKEQIDGLMGKQTLQAALSGFDKEALKLVNTIFAEGTLYRDAAMQNGISVETLLSEALCGNLTVYSDWRMPAPLPPEPPVFDAVDYGASDFVGTWTSLFKNNGDVFACEMTLTADGFYFYTTTINGNLSAVITGIYRIENGTVALKTFELEYDYPLVEAKDLMIDITFAADGLVRATFVELRGTAVTFFEQTLICGNIKPVNYSDKPFIGKHQSCNTTIQLLANGSALVTFQDITVTAYYRVTNDGRLFIFSNGVLGTGELNGILGR